MVRDDHEPIFHEEWEARVLYWRRRYGCKKTND
ncbi:hypothetical protein IC805_00755 [Geobacillus thermoleovorans]|nr:hypothetical protein [Geobacillus sp. DSP4a]QNU23141.1 hypothetical protein IC805_00755 [Geobacillus thermoleovorans]TLS32345.1 hypothetical protein FDK15_14045 [Geobacillus thermoleovorans]